MFAKVGLLGLSLTCGLVNSSYWWLDKGTFSKGASQEQQETISVRSETPVQHVDLGNQENLVPENILTKSQEPVYTDELFQNGNIVQEKKDYNQEEEIIDLPITECPNPTTCVGKGICQGTNYEKEHLIPCMVQTTRQIGVCCSEFVNTEVLQHLPSEQLQQSAQQINNFPVEVQPTLSRTQSNTCPVITNIQSFTECRGRQSNCWSVGVPDLDCLDNSLCCFDGCVNVCLGNGPVIQQSQVLESKNQPLILNTETNNENSLVLESGSQAQGSNLANIIIPVSQRTVNSKPNSYGLFTGSNGSPVEIVTEKTDKLQQPTFLPDNQQVSYNNPEYAEPAETTYNVITYAEDTTNTITNQYQDTRYNDDEKFQETVNTNNYQSLPPVNTVNYQLDNIKYSPIVFPDDKSNPSSFTEPETLFQTNASPQYVQDTDTFEYSPKQPQTQTTKQFITQPDPISTTVSSILVQQESTQTPWVLCPSAMKCVPRQNCDLNGIMVELALNYSPELETLRGPLIPCVNQQRGNQIDVCCRDPNYKDPWPNMNGNGNQQEIAVADISSSQVISSQIKQDPGIPKITPQRRRVSNGYGK